MTTLPMGKLWPAASNLVYGCMRVAGDWDAEHTSTEQQAMADRALDVAVEQGITVFDHADIYCHGRSEAVFGDWLRRRPGMREQLFIQSKGGIRFADERGPGRYDASREWIISCVEESLARLGVEHLDAWLLHRPDPLLQVEELAEAMLRLRSAGKVRHFGVSNMAPAQQRWLARALDEPLIISQIEMSLTRLDWLDGSADFNTDRRVTSDAAACVALAAETGCQLQAWGSLSQGRFAAGAEGGGDVDRQTRSQVTALASRYDCSNEAIVLAFLLRHPVGIQPVIGSTNTDRIRSACEAVSIELSREDWYALYVARAVHRSPEHRAWPAQR